MYIFADFVEILLPAVGSERARSKTKFAGAGAQAPPLLLADLELCDECSHGCLLVGCAEDAEMVGARQVGDVIGEPGWGRTSDLLIKSQLLYR